MIDYSYVECSMASLTGLYDFHEKFPNFRSDEIKYSIKLGREFMKSIQREDGSWLVLQLFSVHVYVACITCYHSFNTHSTKTPPLFYVLFNTLKVRFMGMLFLLWMLVWRRRPSKVRRTKVITIHPTLL